MALVVKNLSANEGNISNTGLIPGSQRSPGGGHGNPLQYSCLENPTDRGAWWATVYRVAKSGTWLKRLSPHACITDLQCCDSLGGQQRDSVIHICVLILPQKPLPSMLPHNTEQSSVCYTAGPCWLSILNTAECTCPSQTPKVFLPHIILPWKP